MRIDRVKLVSEMTRRDMTVKAVSVSGNFKANSFQRKAGRKLQRGNCG